MPALRRAVPASLAIVVVVLAVLEFRILLDMPVGRELGAVDINGYLDATRRWLGTGSPYVASEVQGPYSFGPHTFLHPPIALYLFTPFTALPVFLWWLIPFATVIASLIRWRPDHWFWPILAACLLWPRTQQSLLFGNTDMWVTAFVALGIRFGWPALLVIVKPSFAPLVLVGATARSWWLGVSILAIAALPFGHLWLDWLAVVRHAPAGLDYSLTSLPMVLIPVAAWVRRTRGREPASWIRRPAAGLRGWGRWRAPAAAQLVVASSDGPPSLQR